MSTISGPADHDWGPLEQPIHRHAPKEAVQWRDNAYVSFWDVARRVFGNVHVSTSPNSAGRRARATVSVDGRVVEVIEDLGEGTFTGPSIHFGLDGRITVDHPTLRLQLSSAPTLTLADFTKNSVIPQMGSEPLQHYQRTVTVEGTCDVGGGELPLVARGVRDRTWGPRDEAVNISEYVWFFVAFSGWSLTAMRFTGAGDFDRTDGYILTAAGDRAVMSLELVRDARGLCAEVAFSATDGSRIELASSDPLGGFWVPMGSARRGPAMSAYDEFSVFTSGDGEVGFGVGEFGTVRHLC